MARKAAQKAAKASPLDGLSIATSGRFPGTTQSALQARVTALGATIAASVTADTNYLIATEKDFESNSAKIKAAASNDVPVVTLAWLEECEEIGNFDTFHLHSNLKLTIMADAKADETQYLLSSSSTTASPPPQKQAKGKKRAATPDASPAPSQDASEAKKPKISEKAKVGDGQNAKSSKINIPLDEYCPLPSYHVHIDQSDGTIWDASLNQTNASANNNKFYKVQVRCPFSIAERSNTYLQ